MSVPKPTSADNFIDLADMVTLPEADKRAMILAWAEAIEPGFVEAKEEQVATNLATRLVAPVRQTISLI